MTESIMHFIHEFKILIYTLGIIFILIASAKASDPQTFWPPDMVPHPHVPHPKPNPNDNQA